MRAYLILRLFCLVSLLVSAGCGERGGKTGLMESGEVEMVRRDFSFAAGGKVALPESLPEDLPLYPGGLLKMARESRGKNPEATVILGIPVPPSEVIDYYLEEMKEKDWRFLGDAAVDEQQYLGFRKGRRFVTVIVTPEQGESLVGVVYLVKNIL
jgi:hypothetical protein